MGTVLPHPRAKVSNSSWRATALFALGDRWSTLAGFALSLGTRLRLAGDELIAELALEDLRNAFDRS
jgi:hypothetical protein